ncbi:hypothetical protein FRC00_013212 [Tulasnella sp. 408]|nr:hypothetical protein FRC00_013212 [Tulasnella sp. 408]
MSSSTVTSTAALASASSDDGVKSNAPLPITKDNLEGLVMFSVGALRRLMKEEMKDRKPKPVIYGAWADLRDDDHSPSDCSQQWGELYPLSLSKILSEPVPRKPKERPNLFVNYATSILELFSAERMDKALLDSMQREEPTPEYTKSELTATFLVAMPRATGYDAMEGVSLLPELEVGVYLGPRRTR